MSSSQNRGWPRYRRPATVIPAAHLAAELRTLLRLDGDQIVPAGPASTESVPHVAALLRAAKEAER